MNDIYKEQIKKKKEEIFKERQIFQKEKESWEQMFSEQKKRLEKLIEFFKQYNQNKELKMLKLKEEEKISQLQEDYKNKDIQFQINDLKNLYESKLKSYINKKEIFDKENEEFKKYKEDINNNIEIKKLEIEQKNIELIKLNSEINQRYNNNKNKEMYLKDKYEDYSRIKYIVETKEKNNIQNESDLKLAADRFNKYTDEIIQKENYIEKEKAFLLKKNEEVKEQQKIINEEKINLEHKKTELNLRYQNLNSLPFQSPNMIMLNNNNKQINMEINNIYNNDIDFGETNYDKRFIDEGNFNNFNANRYIKAVKDRIENGKSINFSNYKMNGKKFDIVKEQLYIKKRKGEFKKYE